MRTLFDSKWLVALLFAVLVAQVLVREGRQLPPLPLGPLPGTPVPDLTVGRLDGQPDESLENLVSSDQGCSLLVVVSPTCPTCARMRTTWPERFSNWADSVGADVRPIWLSEGGRDAFDAFTNSYPLNGITLTFLLRGTTAHAYSVLGVLGTPTLYLIDSAGVVQAGLLGNLLPPTDLARNACR